MKLDKISKQPLESNFELHFVITKFDCPTKLKTHHAC